MANYEDKNGRSRPRKPKKPEAPDFRFINHRLSAEMGRELESMDVETEFPVTMLFELVETGYSVKLSFDANSQSYRCALTDTTPGDFQNACVSGYGATWQDAWYALAYRHFYLAQGDWSVLDTARVERGRFG